MINYQTVEDLFRAMQSGLSFSAYNELFQLWEYEQFSYDVAVDILQYYGININS